MQFTPSRILVFSPHPDDETIGCGGFLLKCKQKDAIIKIALVTKGELFEKNYFKPVRINEFKNALKKFDISDFEFLDEKDGNIPLSGNILNKYLKVYNEFLPDTILLPSPFDNNKDHVNITRGVIKALTGNLKNKVNLLFYEVVNTSEINYIVDISEFFDLKKDIFKCYKSQLTRYNYLQSMEAIASLRGSQIGKPYGEGFILYNWDGTKENFFPHLPLVSVVLRAQNETFIKNAIQSLTKQTYPYFEVVIVWFGENELNINLFPQLSQLDVKFIKGKKNRSYNLNIALKNCEGDFIAFLDEDDYWYKNHLSLLVEKLYSDKDIDIVYSGCNVRKIAIKKDKIVLLEFIDIFNEDYIEGRLYFENYIPLISVIIRREIVKHIKFSEKLSVYEDWLFFVELEKHSYNFYHIDKVTCEYRITGNSLEEVHRKKKYFAEELKIREKILEKITPDIFSNLASLWKKTFSKSLNLNNRIKELAVDNLNLKHQLKRYENQYRDLKLIDSKFQMEQQNISFAIIIVAYKSNMKFLEELVKSIKSQIYKNWKLYILNNGADKNVKIYFETLMKDKNWQDKIIYRETDKNIGIAKGYNECCNLAKEDYFVIVDHDDFLYSECLIEVAKRLHNKNYQFCYTDSYTIDLYGKPIVIHNKPDWSPETLLSFNYINHLSIFKKELWKKLNGYNYQYEGVQDWDILLKMIKILKEDEVLHINKPLYGWRASKGSVAYKVSEKEWLKSKSKKLWSDYYFQFTKNKILEKEIKFSDSPGFKFFINRNFQPTLHIIIPSKNSLNLLKPCINSLLINKYRNIQITVVNTGIKDKNLLNFLHNNNIEVITDKNVFNWSALNNQVARKSNAELLLFLNDDVLINDKTFLIKLVQPFLLKKVGVAGALLKFPDGKIQHNGIITDQRYVAYEDRDTGEYNQKNIMRNVSAVTGACMIVRKDIFDKVEGFDENLPNNYNDVDFCLKVRKEGFRVVMFPDAKAIHYHMISRGKSNMPELWEIKYIQKKWGKFLKEKYVIKWEKIGETQIILKVEND